MRLATLFLSSVYITSLATARPSRLAERQASRRLRGSRPFSGSVHNLTNGTVQGGSAISADRHDEYSENWAGVIIESPPSGQNFSTVTGTIVVPTPSGTNGSGSAWVGIDGDTASQSILQAGIDFTLLKVPELCLRFYELCHLCLSNQSTGKSVSQSLTAPSSSSALKGQNAEWIVEDYEEGGNLVAFANFGTVTFSGANASTSSKTKHE